LNPYGTFSANAFPPAWGFDDGSTSPGGIEDAVALPYFDGFLRRIKSYFRHGFSL
jgi:hypothetical protein